MSDISNEVVNLIVTTTDDTPTSGATFDLNPGSVGQVTATIVGRLLDSSAAVTSKIIAAVKYPADGSASITGPATALFTQISDSDLDGSSVTIDVSSNTAQVLVTGITGKTIEWATRLELLFLSSEY